MTALPLYDFFRPYPLVTGGPIVDAFPHKYVHYGRFPVRG